MFRRKSYSSDLSTPQWNKIRRLLPKAKPGGRPRSVDLREVFNAILYRLSNGCKWQDLPHDFPPHQTVYEYYNAWLEDGTWQRIHHLITKRYREEIGRKKTPSAGVIDSQSVKSANTARQVGYDAGKKIKGRKRHILVDTQGIPQKVKVHRADIQDRDGARLLLEDAKPELPRMKHIWADGGYAGRLVDWAKDKLDWTVDIVKKLPKTIGFSVLPRRWVVERTFAWFGAYRLLDKEHETRPEASEADIHAVSTHRLLRLSRAI
jgi:putative transposase